MNTAKKLELYRQHLFENPEKPLPPATMNRLVRIRQAYTHWNEFPMKSEAQIKNFLLGCGINKTIAYEDIQIIKALLGNVKNAAKEWHRYRVIAMLEEGYRLARIKRDPKAIAMVAEKYGKYTQLHIPDHENIPWEQIIPQLIEPTEDPTVIGLERDPNVRERAKKLLKKYSNEITATVKAVHVEDAEFIDVTEDAEE